MIPLNWVWEEKERISPYIHATPLAFDAERNIHLKMENRQITGSFKLRGALNKILSMEAWERDQGLVAASTGNHGQGVAYAARICNTSATIFLPKTTSTLKVDAIRSMGAELVFVDGGYELAETNAQEYAKQTGKGWISAYNDGQVIAGQGTIALELLEQVDLSTIKSCIIPIGGGGLLSGVAAVLKDKAPHIKIIGVQSEASPYFQALFKTNNQDGITECDSLADGLKGGIEDGSITIPLVKKLADDMILVSEHDTAKAISWCWNRYRERIEGSAAVTIASVLSGTINQFPAVLILSGGNIDPDLHARICEQYREDA